MRKDFGKKKKLWKFCSRVQRGLLAVPFSVRRLAAIMRLEDESAESQRGFYLVSVIVLVSLVFLSPDKILQTILSAQPEIAVPDVVKELLSAIKRIVPM